MKHVNVQIALHHHQPVGNLPGVLDECYVKCYGPLLEAIERHPRLKCSLSYSGPLLHYFERRYPDYLERLKRLTASRQVEILADGFYEPILAEISEDDRQAQIRLMQEWMNRRLGVVPEGIWLAEGVWENSLAGTFHQAGLKYTLIRAERMIQAGVPESGLHGYHVTEHHGNVLRLFPRDPNLFRMIPYGNPEELGAYLRRMANRNTNASLTFCDNAERWGVWPGSHEKVQQSGCMERLFEFLCGEGDWLRLKTFSEILKEESPQGRCYIPAGPSSELGMWSLPDESRKQFVSAMRNLEQRHDAGRFLPFFRTGSWGGFRSRYFEANLMEKKLLWLKRRVEELPPELREACMDLLWQCQCNTAYWHGTSGGIYLPHLRHAIWRRLLEAQGMLDKQTQGWRAETADFDADGCDEVLITSRMISAGITPSGGGALFELSLLAPRHNLSATLTRRCESEPGEIETSGTAGRRQDLFHDSHERRIFMDRFISRHTTVEEFNQGRFHELGDFAGAAYRLLGVKKKNAGVEVELEREGGVFQGGSWQKIRLVKTYAWGSEGRTLTLNYKIRNESLLPVESCFAVEFNFFVPLEQPGIDLVVLPGKTHSLKECWYEGRVQGFEIRGGSSGFATGISSACPFSVWSHPLLCLSEAEGGGPLSHQGNAWICGWNFDLKPAGEASYTLKLDMLELTEKKFECP